MDLKYREEGGCRIPNLAPPRSAPEGLGPLAMRRLEFLRSERPALYTDLLTSGELEGHLAEVEQSALQMTEAMVSRAAAAQGVDENLKRRDRQRWIRAMGAIRAEADGTVMRELILS